MAELPTPLTRSEEYLAAVHTELRGLRQDVGELLRVLTPVAPSEPVEGVVELVEPATPKPPRKPRQKG